VSKCRRFCPNLAHALIDRLHNEGVRVVVISGYADVPLAPGKVAAILEKPIREELLFAALRPMTKAAQ
jgi:FixJ family two-component response regulator